MKITLLIILSIFIILIGFSIAQQPEDSTTVRDSIKKDNFFKKLDWTIVASLGTIVAALAAIIALWQGSLQFRKSIERADRQIQILINEREQRELEYRPLISQSRYKTLELPNIRQFALEFDNNGKMPAFDFKIRSYVINTDSAFNSYKLIEQNEFSTSNPLAPNGRIEYFQNIPIKEHDHYYVYLVVEYSDFQAKKFVQEFYFHWEILHDEIHDPNRLYGVDINKSKRIKEIILYRNK